jgi:glycosyltransferase involved in cell wall biosynthesis
MPNAAPTWLYPVPIWNPRDADRPRLVCLARHDIWHKGLDVLAEIARALPEADFVVYGVADPKHVTEVQEFVRLSPKNLVLGQPVFGDAKDEVLASATMYIQTSRYESLSHSVLEAMTAGLPMAVSSYIGRELKLSLRGAGLVLGDDPRLAASQLRSVLLDRQQLVSWSRAARELALSEFDPQKVAQCSVDMYTVGGLTEAQHEALASAAAGNVGDNG